MKPGARENWPLVRAREIIQRLQIKEPDEIDVEAIAFELGVFVQYQPLDGMDGNIYRNGDKAIITINSNLTYPGQIRFVIAHELGHYFLHPNARQIDSVDAQQSSNWSDKQEKEEYEANLFAAELLLPEAIFKSRIARETPSLAFIESLSKEFNTTFTSTAVQFVQMTQEECVIVSCEKRRRLWFIPSHGFSFFLHSDNQIHGHSCAAYVGPKKLKDRSDKIDAGFWFQNYEHEKNAYITEDARYFSKLGRTLSLLWVHEAI